MPHTPTHKLAPVGLKGEMTLEEASKVLDQYFQKKTPPMKPKVVTKPKVKLKPIKGITPKGQKKQLEELEKEGF